MFGFGKQNPTFDPDRDIPSLNGKTILVTGGNIGLGKESIYQLSKHNPSQIYLAARTESKARETIEDIKKKVPNAKITFLEMDLTSFDSVKKAADTFTKSEKRLDILMNNAGIMACPPGLTKQGYEIQFGTNHMGHSLLTKLLLPTLQRTAKEPNADVRIIDLSSAAHAWAPKGGFLPETLKTDMSNYSTWARYGQSKLANVHHARALSKRYPEIKCISLHPGSVNTNLSSGPKASYPMFESVLTFIMPWLTVTVQEGALNQLWAATSKEAKSGLFYNPVAKETLGTAYAQDEKLTEEIWEWTEKELKSHGF